MKTLMITSSYPKFPGDVTAPFIESIARGVAARGHRVDVVLPHHPDLRRSGDEPVRFFPYRYAPWRWLNIWGYAQSLEDDARLRRRVLLLAPVVAAALRSALGARLRAEHYDVVHTHWLVPNAAFIADVVRSAGLPHVISLHGSDVSAAERFAAARLPARAALREAGHVTACSGDLRTRAIALGADPRRIRTLPYGVDATLFGGGADPDMRGELGVRSDTLLVLAVGRLVEKKGFVHLVNAAATLRGVDVVIAGEGDLRQALERQAAELRAPVRLVGALPRDTLARALRAADVVAVPSVVDRSGNVDGLPNTLLEALAAGRAVVASRVAGIPDVVRDGINGLLVPPGNPGALAEALQRLENEPALRESLGAAARRHARDELTWEHVAARLEEAYVEAAALATR